MFETGKAVPFPARTCRTFGKRDLKFPSGRGKTTDQHSLLSVIEHHRNRERIKDMGEVFTPERYVQEILGLFDEKVWSDESVVFFEPACGHGNIALAIVERRINALVKNTSKRELTSLYYTQWQPRFTPYGLWTYAL